MHQQAAIATPYGTLATASNIARVDQSGEMFKGTIVFSFRLRRETTAGQLSRLQMIADALATKPLSRTRIIGTGTRLKILRLITFHGSHSLLYWKEGSLCLKNTSSTEVCAAFARRRQVLHIAATRVPHPILRLDNESRPLSGLAPAGRRLSLVCRFSLLVQMVGDPLFQLRPIHWGEL